MAAVDDVGPVTRSRIEAFDQTAASLSDFAGQWRDQVQRLQQAAKVYVEQVNIPNGAEWGGQTAVSYFDTAHADRMAVLPAVDHVHAMADVADRGGEQLLAAQQAALAAIAEAEADDFGVAEDLSVTDSYTWPSPTVRAVRQAAAVGYGNYVAYQAGLLEAANQRIAAQLTVGAAQMTGMAPAHWRQPLTEYSAPTQGTTTDKPNGTIQAVDHHTWKQDPDLPTPPVDPKDMTEQQARDAWDKVNNDVARWNARCGRTFIVPNEQAAYDSCVAQKGPLLERQAAIRTRLDDLGIPLAGEEPAPEPQPAAGEPPIPQGVQDTLQQIDAGKWPGSAGAPGTRGGSIFDNDEQLLPATDASGNLNTYKEWDVNPKIPNQDRDLERIVTGSDGSAWYTTDHYRTFHRIR